MAAHRRQSSDGYWTSGGSRGSGRLVLVRRPTFWLRKAIFGFPEMSVGRWLVVVGRLVRAGRPVAVDLGQLLRLFLVLGVLAVLSMVFHFVPGHA